MADPYTQNPTLAQVNPAANNQRQPLGINRIPQYFYPRYNEPEPYQDYPPPNDQPYYPVYEQPPAPIVTQPVPNQTLPYQPPAPLTTPYAPDPYNPYPSPYLVPLGNNVRFDQAPPVQQQIIDPNASNLAARQRDADLSRLEVYHFAPKPPTVSNPAAAAPVIQYHVYSYPPGNQPPVVQQNPPSNIPVPAPSYDPFVPNIEKKARGIQTEPADMKNRGVSPLFIPERRTFDEPSYSRPQQVVAYNDRHDHPRRRNQTRHYQDSRSLTPLDDCRCLDCRRDRERILNYYDD